MLGDREAVVTEVKPFDLHGVTYYDLALIFSDGSTQSARLGPEGVPDGLKAGIGCWSRWPQHGGLPPPALPRKRPALTRLVRCKFV
jgi:hypothetical protein